MFVREMPQELSPASKFLIAFVTEMMKATLDVVASSRMIRHEVSLAIVAPIMSCRVLDMLLVRMFRPKSLIAAFTSVCHLYWVHRKVVWKQWLPDVRRFELGARATPFYGYQFRFPPSF